MKERHERAGVALGRFALGNVGEVEREQYAWGNAGGPHVIHVRRPVTLAEEASLPAWFLACEATDRAGGRPLKWRP